MAGNIIALSFIIISACCAVPLHNDCSITSGWPWDEEGRELTKEDIHYCLIDNCTIRRMDTGQELDIIDADNDTLITVARGNHTSMIFALLPNEEYCLEVNNDDDTDHVRNMTLLAMKAVLLMLVVLLSGYVITVYLLWDRLQSSVGKLFITYNSLLAADKLVLLFLMAFHTTVKVTAPFCQLIIYTVVYLKLSNQISLSFLFIHIAYLLYQSHSQHLEVSDSWKKKLVKFYTFTTFTAVIPMIIFIALLDVLSGAGDDTISSDGYCILPPLTGYSSFFHLYGYSVPYKLVLIVAFMLIVACYKNLYNPLTGSTKAADVPNVNGEPKVTLLFGLALVTMIFVSCYSFLWFVTITFLSHLYTVSLYIDLIASVMEIMQQFIIAVKLTILLKIKGFPIFDSAS